MIKKILETGASLDICTDIYAGSESASEPETKAVQNFILSKSPNWISFVTLHRWLVNLPIHF